MYAAIARLHANSKYLAICYIIDLSHILLVAALTTSQFTTSSIHIYIHMHTQYNYKVLYYSTVLPSVRDQAAKKNSMEMEMRNASLIAL